MSEEARKRIQVALETGSKELDISRLSLTKLPKELLELKSLTSLNLWYNYLKELPESMGQMSNLKSLNLGYNYLKELPEWMGQMRGLQGVGALRGNHLTYPPQAIANWGWKAVRIQEKRFFRCHYRGNESNSLSAQVAQKKTQTHNEIWVFFVGFGRIQPWGA